MLNQSEMKNTVTEMKNTLQGIFVFKLNYGYYLCYVFTYGKITKPQDLLGTQQWSSLCILLLTQSASLLAVYWNRGFDYQINVRQQRIEL